MSERGDFLFHRRQIPPPAKYFFAIMLADRNRQGEVEARIQEKLGPIDLRSPFFPFSEFSSYYAREMGPEIWKYFAAVHEELSMDQLSQVKLFAEDLEIEFAVTEQGRGAKRNVNLDPGYVTGWSVVLSTVKNRAHRVYLGQGIFAEVTLLYQKGGYSRLPWTYPDYDTTLAQDFFLETRSLLRKRQNGP